MSLTRFAAALGAALMIAVTSTAFAQQEPSFGGEDDLVFAEKLWRSLIDARLVGSRSINAQPYEGSEPHGVILMTLDSTLSLDGREAAVIVKKNYMGEGISIESVATNPALFLDAITVMFRRESGYDDANQNWFWAKFRADGTLHANPRGRLLAGRVAKNPEDGCIGCHQFAPGDDFVFLHDRFAPLEPATIAAAADDPVPVITGLAMPAVPPDELTLLPGLSVVYFPRIFNLVTEVGEQAKIEPGIPGPPLPMLDYKTGNGEVLTSGVTDAVGARIRGFINFPEVGTYTLAMQSNDGVRLEIGGRLIVSDPTVHADRFSPLVPIAVDRPGWYALSLLYFEKRNTSTLQLFWRPPGQGGGLTFVPQDALAHGPQ